MRDYITHDIQEAQSLLENLSTQEEAIKEGRRQRDRQQQRNAENAASQARDAIIRARHSPTAVYEYLAAVGVGSAVDFRSAWQDKNKKVDCLREDLQEYFQESFKSPKIDLSLLPSYSFVFQFSFTLAQPYISRDEQDFYILDNPIRKDRIFELPYVAPTSWKGSLRAALWKEGYREENEQIYRLFGNNKGEENQEKLHEGRLFHSKGIRNH